jgi:hypothetical protein
VNVPHSVSKTKHNRKIKSGNGWFYRHKQTDQLQKSSLLARSCGCNWCFTVFLNCFYFRSFVAIRADDFETPISCARRPRDFRGVCSSLAPISSNFSDHSGFRFGLLSSNEALCFDYNSMNISLCGTITFWNLRRNLLLAFNVDHVCMSNSWPLRYFVRPDSVLELYTMCCPKCPSCNQL